MFYGSDGSLLLEDPGCLEREPYVWRALDVATGRETLVVPLPDLGRNPWALLPSNGLGRWLLIRADDRLVCIDLTTGQKHTDLKTPFGLGREDLSADGKIITAYDPNQTQACWVANSADGKWSRIPGVHPQGARALAPNGQWLATELIGHAYRPWYARWLPSSDGSISVVRLPHGEEIARYRGGTQVQFAPDNQTLAVYSNNEFQVQLWDFPPRRAWGWIVGGTAAAGLSMYWFLTWRSRRARSCATPSE